MQETQVQFLSGEDSLENEMATHSSILAWRIPRAEDAGGYSPWGYKESETTEYMYPGARHIAYLCLQVPCLWNGDSDSTCLILSVHGLNETVNVKCFKPCLAESTQQMLMYWYYPICSIQITVANYQTTSLKFQARLLTNQLLLYSTVPETLLIRKCSFQSNWSKALL